MSKVTVRCALICLLILPELVAEIDHPAKVTLMRVPEGGIQPHVAVDAKGGIHLLYYNGDPQHGDLYYVRSHDGGKTFSRPLRVNSIADSAIALGNIRGGHLAIGKNGLVHVAWNGAQGGLQAPMLYTRLNDEGTVFEPQRNLIQRSYGLDGGGAVAADAAGNVYVLWHAPQPGTEGEGNRRVWITRSCDDGKTFEPERPVYNRPTGACGCCGLNAFADRSGALYVLYRSATEMVHRDMYLLVSRDHGGTFQGQDISPWNVGYCVMSSEAFAESRGSVLAAWENEKQAYFARIGPDLRRITPQPAPGTAENRKYPAVAVNAQGETVFVWTEDMGWKKGGRVAWQVYNKSGTPTADHGIVAGVPPWSLVAAFPLPDGTFSIVY
jgi:hypothetical protein